MGIVDGTNALRYSLKKMFLALARLMLRLTAGTFASSPTSGSNVHDMVARLSPILASETLGRLIQDRGRLSQSNAPIYCLTSAGPL